MKICGGKWGVPMKKEPKNDLRYQKTHDLIRGAFQEMLLEMDYSQIMVKDLAERARINRKTFYLHYETLDDLLTELQEEMGKQFLAEIEGYQVPNDIDKIVLSIFKCAESNGQIGERILCSVGHSSVGRNLANKINAQTWRFSDYIQSCNTFEQNIISTYLTTSISEIYKRWVEDHRQIPFEKIVSLSTHLISQGIYGLTGYLDIPL